MEIDNGETRAVPQEKYDLLLWTERETLFRNRNRLRNKVLSEICVPFSIALHVKLRRCILGTYLKSFNKNQEQNGFLNNNKLCITDTILKEHTEPEKNWFDYNNNLFGGAVEFLKDAVRDLEEINHEFLYQQTRNLRLDDYHVNFVDKGLRNFRNLQVLVLCGNWIGDLEGSVLPRRLKFLELYANELTTVVNLARGAPKGLLHLGLSRNKLTNDSCLHLLGIANTFRKLKSLDLSECDIYRLNDVLSDLKNLKSLESLLLIGNPCSVVMTYKDAVLSNFPDLIFLDGAEILWPDRKLIENYLESVDKAELNFNCFKISGLPSPPKDKSVKQTIHLEFDLPLLQNIEIINYEPPEIVEKPIELTDTGKKTKGKKKTNKEKKKSSKSSKSSKKGKKGTLSPYDKDDEYNPRMKNYFFETDRKPWSKIMSYPSIPLTSPENNLIALRDTLRSSVNVRLVYLKVLVPKPQKKGKKDKKKSKKDKKKDKGKDKKKKGKGLKGQNDNEENKTEEKTIEKPNEEPKEIILKRVTLANFTCDLDNIDWSENNLEFYWSEDPIFGKKAMQYKDYTEMLREAKEKALAMKSPKQDKKGKDKKGKKGKDSKKGKEKAEKKSKKSKKSKGSKKSKAPDYLCCQLKFSLTRGGNKPVD